MMPMLAKDMVAELVRTGGSARSALDVAPKFKVGQQVRALNINPVSHTRLASYVKGKVGRIEMDHGVFVLPDTMAHGGEETPQHVYSVAFTARELWGGQANALDTVRIDLWDNYLESL